MPKKLAEDLRALFHPFLETSIEAGIKDYGKIVYDVSLKDYKATKKYLTAKRAAIGVIFGLAKMALDIGCVDDGGASSVPDQVLRALMESSKRQNEEFDRRHPNSETQ